jgi:hypothetical protein
MAGAPVEAHPSREYRVRHDIRSPESGTARLAVSAAGVLARPDRVAPSGVTGPPTTFTPRTGSLHPGVEMITTYGDRTETDGLDIFDDVHDVSSEPMAYTALQVVIAVLGYALILGIAVVVVVKGIELLWPVLLFVVFPWLMSLLSSLG